MEIARDFGQCAIICRSSESQNTRTKQRNATRRRRQAISSGNSRREIDVCVYRSSGNAILAHCWCATGFGSVASRVSRSSACAPSLQLNGNNDDKSMLCGDSGCAARRGSANCMGICSGLRQGLGISLCAAMP